MNYRELQTVLKEHGLSAYGKKIELEQRWNDYQQQQLQAERPVYSHEVAHFVFVGDDGKRTRERTFIDQGGNTRVVTDSLNKPVLEEIQVEPSNPSRIRWGMGGDEPQTLQTFYEFELNGAPVAVDDSEAIHKLRNHRHFKEVARQ